MNVENPGFWGKPGFPNQNQAIGVNPGNFPGLEVQGSNRAIEANESISQLFMLGLASGVAGRGERNGFWMVDREPRERYTSRVVVLVPATQGVRWSSNSETVQNELWARGEAMSRIAIDSHHML